MPSETTTNTVITLLILLTCNAHFQYLFGTTIEESGGSKKEIAIRKSKQKEEFNFYIVFEFSDGCTLCYHGTGGIYNIEDNKGVVGLVSAMIDFSTVVLSWQTKAGRPERSYSLPDGKDPLFSLLWEKADAPEYSFFTKTPYVYGEEGFGSFGALEVSDIISIPYTE